MKTRMLLTFLAVMLPLVASATHFTDVRAMGDCAGWNLETDVYWRSGVLEGELTYVIQLLDAESNVLETQTWTGPVERHSTQQTYAFDGEWTVNTPGGSHFVGYDVRIVASYGDDLIDDEQGGGSQAFECETVANEPTSWSSVKALYR